MAFVLFLGACANFSSVKQNYFDENGVGDNISSTILLMDSTRVEISCDYVIGDKLIFDCIRSPHRYEIFTIKGDSLIFEKKFMNIGRGPYEMSNPNLKYDCKNNRMFVYSSNNLEDKLFVIDLNNFNNMYNPTSWEKKKLPILYTRGCLEIINDTVFLNKNYTKTSNMFSLSYAGGKDNVFKCLDFKYPGEHPNLSLINQNYLFSGDLKQGNNSLTFVYSCYFSKYIFIFDIINEQIANIRYISQELPVYKANPNDNLNNPIAIADEYERGFNVFQVTDKYVYIGYNNVNWGQIRNRTKFKDYPHYYFDRINIFDLNGNFVKRLVLDKPIYKITISSNNKNLYGSSVDLNKENQPSQLLRFTLKGL